MKNGYKKQNIGILNFPKIKKSNSGAGEIFWSICKALEFYPDLDRKSLKQEQDIEKIFQDYKIDYKVLNNPSLLDIEFGLKYYEIALISYGDPEDLLGNNRYMIVHGRTVNNVFKAVCSFRGRIDMTSNHLEQLISLPSSKTLYFSLERELHKDVISIIKEQMKSSWKPVADMTLDEFLKTKIVIPNKKLTPYHQEAIQYAKEYLSSLKIDGKDNWEIDYAPLNEKGFIVKGIPRNGYTQDMAVFKDGEIVGGIASGLTFVFPNYRKQGIGAEIILCAHQEPERRYLRPDSYSESGYNARLKAYELAQSRKLSNGMKS